MKSSNIRGDSSNKTALLLSQTQYQLANDDKQVQNSFIPNNNQNEYIELWKDFRNDIRKKFESGKGNTSRTRGGSIEKDQDKP